MSFPRRGELFWVKLDPTVGAEIAKTRPGAVISNDLGNRHSSRVIVAPVSSSTSKVYPFEVLIPTDESGFSKDSKILLDQIRCVDKSRLGDRIGVLSYETMRLVERAIHVSLGLGCELDPR